MKMVSVAEGLTGVLSGVGIYHRLLNIHIYILMIMM